MFCWVYGQVPALNNKGGFLDLPVDVVNALINEGKAQFAASPFAEPAPGVETTWHGSQAIIHEGPPHFVVNPSIIGTAQVGQTLSCDAGRWIGYPAPVVAYQWVSNDVDIPGANQQFYLLTVGETFEIVYCRVTLTNSAGSAIASSNTMFINSAPPLVTVEDTDADSVVETTTETTTRKRKK